MELLIWVVAGLIMYLLMYAVTRNLYNTEYGSEYDKEDKIRFPRIIYFILFLVMLVPVVNIGIFIVLLVVWIFNLVYGDVGYNPKATGKIMKFFSEKV